MDLTQGSFFFDPSGSLTVVVGDLLIPLTGTYTLAATSDFNTQTARTFNGYLFVGIAKTPRGQRRDRHTQANLIGLTLALGVARAGILSPRRQRLGVCGRSEMREAATCLRPPGRRHTNVCPGARMKSTLIINDDEGQRSAELPKERIVLGASDRVSIPLRGRQLGLLPEHAALVWHAPRATWTLTRAGAPEADVMLNHQPLAPGGSVALGNLDVIQLPGATLQFYREPESPVFRGRPVEEFPLERTPLTFGRGESADASEAPRLELDPEDSSVSKVHAVIEREGSDFFLVDRSRAGTELNGKFFSRERLVYGDRFRIGEYFFEFTGDAIVRVAQASLGRVSAHGLIVDVRKDGRALRILQGISLEIGRGEFVGILGGSGQGKSTLLNALCGANPASGGEVLISGVPLTSREQVNAAGVGFVPQDDIVHPELTVGQAITYSARLRLDLPSAQIAALVERVIERLSLAEHRDKRVARLSGGQRKRVSVAIELLAKPSVLFLDEPSSGLDPATEADLMALLQSLRLTNLTVVCTTHVLQKAYLFDRLVFIHGGRLIFIGTADEARQHFLARGAGDTQAFDRAPLEKIYSLLADPAKTAEAWEQEFLDSPYAQRAAALSFLPPPEAPAVGTRRREVGYLKTLRVLLARQWTALLADPLNLAFLFAQALTIGVMVGWTAENAGMRMFLCVVATLWFGCSNGAQQIIGELPIFRRERVCGLGLNVYLQSKLAFLSLLTVVQAVLLFATIFLTAHLFQTNDFDPALFASRLEERHASMSPAAQQAANESEDFEAVGESNATPAKAAPKAPAADLKPSAPTVQVTSALASFFYLTDNILDSGGRQETLEDGTPIKDRDGRPRMIAGLSLVDVLATTLGLKLAAVLAAALVGVALGLTISALVRSNTQAVLWVPLVLIPQILFGGFVITVPEMSAGVYRFSHFVPSFSAQRIMDVSNVYGQATPFLTNRTKIPLFLTSDGGKEKLTWEENGRQRSQEYDRISLFNTSWQNLLVFPDRVGQHKQEGTRVEDGDHDFRIEYRDTVSSRYDVRYSKGTVFRFLLPAQWALLTLGTWAAVCYGVILLGLQSKQTGK